MIRGHRSIVNKNHSKTVALIFVPSAFLFYSLFNMAFHNQPSSSGQFFFSFFGSILFINLIKTHICKFNDVWFHSSLCYFGNYPLALKPRFIHSLLLLLILCVIGGLRFFCANFCY